MGIGSHIPWQARLGLKVVLAPVPYRVWQRLGWFRHGAMLDPSYVRGVFDKHRRFAGELPPEPVIVELGPGDSVGSALFATADGASRVFLVDVAEFATHDVAVYRAMSAWATTNEIANPDLSTATTFADVLRAWRASYHVHGVRSLSAVPTGSVDHLWSNTVIQHIRLEDIPRLAHELRRVLKPTGVSTHTIDFRDMLGGALNHLRVPDGIWNSRLIGRSGAYTNRMRCSVLLDVLGDAGFEIEVLDRRTWTELPTPRAAMQPQFRDLPDDDLLTYHANVVLRPSDAVVRETTFPTGS